MPVSQVIYAVILYCIARYPKAVHIRFKVYIFDSIKLVLPVVRVLYNGVYLGKITCRRSVYFEVNVGSGKIIIPSVAKQIIQSVTLTGKNIFVDTAGRVEKFNKRYQKK